MSKHVAIVIHLVLEVVSTEPVRTVQDKVFGDCFRGSDEVVRRRHEHSVGASSGYDAILTPVSVCTFVPLGLSWGHLLDHGHH